LAVRPGLRKGEGYPDAGAGDSEATVNDAVHTTCPQYEGLVYMVRREQGDLLHLLTMTSNKKPVGDPRVAVALLRVSTTDQELGPAAQRRAIEVWAGREGIEIRSWRLEQGVSGATPLERRAILLQALDDVKAHRAGVFVVAKRDRLARDVVCAALIERLVERAGARVCAADGTGDTKGPEGALLRGIVDLFASYERLLIASRTKAALGAKKARGERTGGVPFGFHERWANACRERGGASRDRRRHVASRGRANHSRDRDRVSAAWVRVACGRSLSEDAGGTDPQEGRVTR